MDNSVQISETSINSFFCKEDKHIHLHRFFRICVVEAGKVVQWVKSVSQNWDYEQLKKHIYNSN